MLIGISAKKQGGKTVASQVIQGHFPGRVDIKCFADPLKKIVLQCFVPHELHYGLLDLIEDKVKNEIMPCGKSIRELLQIVGTDWFRNTDPEVWVRAMDNSINQDILTVIPDVRFPNEVKFVQDRGGIVVRLLRSPYGNADLHMSETALDSMTERTIKGDEIWYENEVRFDEVIDNRELTISQDGRCLIEVLQQHNMDVSVNDIILKEIEEMYDGDDSITRT